MNFFRKPISFYEKDNYNYELILYKIQFYLQISLPYRRGYGRLKTHLKRWMLAAHPKQPQVLYSLPLLHVHTPFLVLWQLRPFSLGRWSYLTYRSRWWRRCIACHVFPGARYRSWGHYGEVRYHETPSCPWRCPLRSWQRCTSTTMAVRGEGRRYTRFLAPHELDGLAEFVTEIKGTPELGKVRAAWQQLLDHCLLCCSGPGCLEFFDHFTRRSEVVWPWRLFDGKRNACGTMTCYHNPTIAAPSNFFERNDALKRESKYIEIWSKLLIIKYKSAQNYMYLSSVLQHR